MRDLTPHDYGVKKYIICSTGHKYYTINNRRTCLVCGCTEYKNISGKWHPSESYKSSITNLKIKE